MIWVVLIKSHHPKAPGLLLLLPGPRVRSPHFRLLRATVPGGTGLDHRLLLNHLRRSSRRSSSPDKRCSIKKTPEMDGAGILYNIYLACFYRS